MPGSQLKEKMFKCLGQGHKNKENGETHTKKPSCPLTADRSREEIF